MPTRRSILRGIGATAAATGLSLEARAGAADRPDADRVDETDSIGRRQGGVDPIPEAYEIEVGGGTHEVPINREVVRGTCQDLIRFVEDGGVVEPVADRHRRDTGGSRTRSPHLSGVTGRPSIVRTSGSGPSGHGRGVRDGAVVVRSPDRDGRPAPTRLDDAERRLFGHDRGTAFTERCVLALR